MEKSLNDFRKSKNEHIYKLKNSKDNQFKKTFFNKGNKEVVASNFFLDKKEKLFNINVNTSKSNIIKLINNNNKSINNKIVQIERNRINDYKTEFNKTKTTELPVINNKNNNYKLRNSTKSNIQINDDAKSKLLKKISLRNYITELENKLKDSNEKILENNNLIESKKNTLESKIKENKDLESANNILKIKNDIREQSIVRQEASISYRNLVVEMISRTLRETYERAMEERLLGIYPNPDSMSYEELLALGERIGHVSRGLSKENINKIKLEEFNKNNLDIIKLNIENCSICFIEYKEKEKLKKLNCKHMFHPICIDKWLENEKKCPLCKEEVVIK